MNSLGVCPKHKVKLEPVRRGGAIVYICAECTRELVPTKHNKPNK